MGANFTPTFGAYSPLTPFRYWCQKVLPLVYDDSLSYYECLNKTVDYLNKTMEDVETLHGDTEAMLAAFNQLQTYVNTYFDELDLTEEVQTVLDRMAENGTLDALLRPLVGERIGSVVAEQIDDAVAGQIYETVGNQINGAIISVLNGTTMVQDSVEDWLDAHVATGHVVVDNTLTISGAAADAKVTGELTHSTYTKRGSSVTLEENAKVTEAELNIATVNKNGEGLATPDNRRDIIEYASIVITENNVATTHLLNPSIIVGIWNLLTGEYTSDYAIRSYDGTETLSLLQKGNAVASFLLTTPNVATKTARSISSNYFETLSTSRVNVIQQPYSISGRTGGARGFAFSLDANFFSQPIGDMSDEDLVAEVRSWIVDKYNDGHPLVIAYQTNSTTQTGTTTPHVFTLSETENIISTAAGTMNITYRIPLKNAIDKIISETTEAPKEVTTTVLGYDVPDNAIDIFDIDDSYINLMKSTIDAWCSEFAGNDKIIPLIVHTDQHGALNESNKKYFDLLNYLLNWNSVSCIVNLGDCVNNIWRDDPTNANPLLRNGELENMLKCVDSIPVDKQINIYGNHDTWYSSLGTVPTAVEGTLPSLQYLNPYFKRIGLRTVCKPDNSGLMCVYDDLFRVKYVVLANWDYKDKPSDRAYIQTWINQKHLNYIIEELSKNEGYKNIILAHYPLETKRDEAINPISGDLWSGTTWRIIHSTDALNALWFARKNKTSGSVSYGNVSATYDFTNCEDDLICALGGHTHEDLYEYVGGENGLLQVTFDNFTSGEKAIHFVLIDINENKLKTYKLTYGASNYSYWETNLNG